MTAIDTYFKTVSDLIDRALSTQKDAMETAARHIADSVRAGGMLYTFGTGHGHLLALELFYRAGGMARVCPILDEKLMLHVSAADSSLWERDETMTDELLKRYSFGKNDVLISISNSGRNTVPVMLACAAREKGAYTIALTSMKHTASVTPRNKAGLRLFEVVDLVLDNGGVPGDACVPMADGSNVGPTSTVIGAAMLQAIISRVKEIALSEGWDVEFYRSSNIDGGDQYNAVLIDKYGPVIPGLK